MSVPNDTVNDTNHIVTESRSQPECWARALRLFELSSPDGLPTAGERVLVVGCGTSYFMAQAYAARRESLGFGITDAATASDLPVRRAYDRVIAITRSGTTTEVLEALDTLEGAAPRTVITAVADSPVAERAEHLITLAFADERSVVQTRFATTALTLLRRSFGDADETLLEDARAALETPLPDELGAVRQFTFLGRGWTNGLANEAALKLREGAQWWTESYPAMEYRHGPISIAADDSVVMMFGEAPEGLAEQVRATGARFIATGLDPLAQLVVVHRIVVELAAARGLDPDHPRHLTRAVILDGGGE